jgi:hypothetical protein
MALVPPLQDHARRGSVPARVKRGDAPEGLQRPPTCRSSLNACESSWYNISTSKGKKEWLSDTSRHSVRLRLLIPAVRCGAQVRILLKTLDVAASRASVELLYSSPWHLQHHHHTRTIDSTAQPFAGNSSAAAAMVYRGQYHGQRGEPLPQPGR